MAKGTKQVRVSEETLKLIRMHAGELQLATGESISDDKAIRNLFDSFREDLVKKLKSLDKDNKQ